MSRHLRVLRSSGLIEDQRVDEDLRVRLYRLRPERFVALQAWLDQVQAFWVDQLGSFKAHAEGTRRRRTTVTAISAVTATVEVALDSLTAFEVFTEAIGRWWRPGPINWYDARPAVDIRFEPGSVVGGWRSTTMPPATSW